MILLDGKAASARIESTLAEEVRALSEKYGRKPGLDVILVGDDPASAVYVRNKEKRSIQAGIESRTHRLPAATDFATLAGLIDTLNASESTDGILLQLPLPKGLDSSALLERIRPDKDVDGFHPVNMGRLVSGLPGFRPCTPAGIITLLQEYELKTTKSRAVVVGRSNIVGKPLAMLLVGRGDYGNATVTVCHTGTQNLKEICREADFLFAAVGIKHIITADMVKDGAVVVDVGMNREDGKLYGDCDFHAMKDKVRAITPVPGGVGPMTIAQLLLNTVESFRVHAA